MSRLPRRPDRDSIGLEELASYDQVVERNQRMLMTLEPGAPGYEEDYMGGYFSALLQSPPLAAALANLGTLVRTLGDRPGTYSHADREFVDQVLCADWHTNLPLRTHLPDAIAVGVRPEAIRALREGRESELTEDESLLAAYVRQVVAGTVDDATFAAMKARFGSERGIVEYTVFIGVLQLMIRVMQALGVRDSPDQEIDGMLESFLSGKRAVPDYRQRIR